MSVDLNQKLPTGCLPLRSDAPGACSGAEFGMQCPHAERAMVFLAGIGLPVAAVPGARAFVEDIAIVDGGLHVDPQCRASAILHEAGHLAIVPARYRHLLSGNISEGMRLALDEARKLNLGPDDPLARALMQTGDCEATAWAWAAGKHLGMPDEAIIQDDEYGGEGETVRLRLIVREHMGINGMMHAGFCVTRATPYRPLPVYPELAFWLQP